EPDACKRITIKEGGFKESAIEGSASEEAAEEEDDVEEEEDKAAFKTKNENVILTSPVPKAPGIERISSD
ncbi:MAG: hypothetical protein WBF50_00550, partial [Pseudolabrys sp.]